MKLSSLLFLVSVSAVRAVPDLDNGVEARYLEPIHVPSRFTKTTSGVCSPTTMTQTVSTFFDLYFFGRRSRHWYTETQTKTSTCPSVSQANSTSMTSTMSKTPQSTPSPIVTNTNGSPTTITPCLPLYTTEVTSMFIFHSGHTVKSHKWTYTDTYTSNCPITVTPGASSGGMIPAPQPTSKSPTQVSCKPTFVTTKIPTFVPFVFLGKTIKFDYTITYRYTSCVTPSKLSTIPVSTIPGGGSPHSPTSIGSASTDTTTASGDSSGPISTVSSSSLSSYSFMTFSNTSSTASTLSTTMISSPTGANSTMTTMTSMASMSSMNPDTDTDTDTDAATSTGMDSATSEIVGTPTSTGPSAATSTAVATDAANSTDTDAATSTGADAATSTDTYTDAATTTDAPTSTPTDTGSSAPSSSII